MPIALLTSSLPRRVLAVARVLNRLQPVWVALAALTGLAIPTFAAPTVTTPTSSNHALTTVTFGGTITTDGGSAVTERGVVYALTSTNSNPQIGGTGVTKVVAPGTTTGIFTTNVAGLAPGSVYTFAAYATNAQGTGYSPTGSVTTFLPSTTGSTGSASPAAFDNTQPTLAVVWMICTSGVFPLRDGTGIGDSSPLVGEIRPFAGVVPQDTDNWRPCDGALLPITTNSALFSVLGTTYGGNGTTQFALPDMRGRVPVAAGQGNGLTSRALGEKGGTETQTLTSANLPAHTHPLSSGATGSTPGTEPDNNQPWLAVTIFIQNAGVYDTDLGWVRFFAGNFSPGGSPRCDGTLLNIASEETLFNLIQNTFGGDGIETFATPDLRGRAIIGAGTGTGLTARSIGAAIGSETIALTPATIPAHTHTYGGDTTGANSGGGAHDTMQPSLGLNWILSTAGVYGRPTGTTPALAELRVRASTLVPASGWTLAAGASLPIAQNQALYSVLGTSYGGNGTSTFALPDTRGRLLAHNGTGAGLTTRSLAATWGTETVTLTTAHLPAHTHDYGYSPAKPIVNTPTSASLSAVAATLGGNVIDDGGTAITERGVVYALTSANNNPQIGGTGVTKVTTSGTTGVFTAAVTGLTTRSAYTYTAYATNSVGTSYSATGTFTTPSNNANLSAFKLSTGAFSPVFAAGTTAYTASVTSSTTSVTVTPTTADSTATVTVNGTPVTSGTASSAITVNTGTNTLTVTVTAGDGTTVQTYTLTLTRPDAPIVVQRGTITRLYKATAGHTATLTAYSFPAGRNRLLVVSASDGAATSIASVTFGGTAMTRAVHYTDNSSADALFYLAMGSSTSPTVGDIVVTSAGGTGASIELNAIPFSNVDQVTPIDGIVSASSPTSTPQLDVVSRLGDVVLDYLHISKATALSGIGFASGQSLLFSWYGATTSSSYSVSAKAGASSVNMRWVTDATTATQLAFNIRQQTSVGGLFVDTLDQDFKDGTLTGLDANFAPGDLALSGPSVNQSNSTVGTGGYAISSTSYGGQTFTPTITGKMIRASLRLFASSVTGTPPDLTLSVRATSGGLPTGADLATATITGFTSGAGTDYTGVFSSPATLQAGTMYALVIRPVTNPSTGAYALMRSGTSSAGADVYASGSLVTTNGTVWSSPRPGGVSNDAGFSVSIDPGYTASGDLVSSLKDSYAGSGSGITWTTLSWTATTPASTTLKFQVAASASATGPFNFVGPDGTAATFFTTSGASLSQFNGLRYLKYRAFFASSDTAVSPTLGDVVINSQAVALPTITTPTSASVAATTVTLGGNITAEGGTTLTERGVVYALTSANSNPQIGGTGVTKVAATGTTTGVFTANVTGLTPSSDYTFAAYATSSAGTSYSPVGTFTTAPPSAPTVTTPTSTAVAGNTATLGGNVTSAGTSAVTARGIVVAPTATNANPRLGGTGVLNFTATGVFTVFTVSASGLALNTPYTFAAYATNAVGTTYSTTGTFTTGTTGTLVDTLQADFAAGTASTVATTTNPGNLTLAGPFIDQQNAYTLQAGIIFTTTNWSGQTFTAVASGPLTGVILHLLSTGITGTPPDLVVSLRATSAGLPTGADLATATLPGFTTNGVDVTCFFVFASPVMITSGTQYALLVRPTANPATGNYALGFSGSSTLGTDTYAGGAHLRGTTSGTVWANTLIGGATTDAPFTTVLNNGYVSSGNLVSSLKDSALAPGATRWATLAWNATVPTSTTLRFQVAASASPTGPFSFVGPDSTANTYFTTSGASLDQFHGNRYLQYRAYLTSSDPAVSPIVSDVTLTYDLTVIAPVVQLPTSASIASTAATLGGTVTSDGGATLTERGIVYALTATNNAPQIGGTGVTKVVATGTETGGFTTAVTGLAASTGYSYAAYATNSVGTTYSSVATFTTALPPETVTVNGTELASATDLSGNLGTVNAGTVVYTGRVSSSDSSDAIQLSLPAGQTITAATATITNFSLGGGTTPMPGQIAVAGSSASFTANGNVTLTLPTTITSPFTISVSSPASQSMMPGAPPLNIPTIMTSLGTADYVITLTLGAANPTVASVSVPAAGTAKLGDTLDFTVNWSAAVNVVTTGGTPTLGLTVGSTTRAASYVSGSGTTATVFRYTVSAGDFDTDGLTVGTLTLNGGTLKDANANDAVLTLASVGATTALNVDGVVPTLSAVTLVSSNANTARARTGDVVTLTFTASETITTPTVTLAGRSVTPTANGNTWTAATTMLGTDPEGTVAFSIAYADLAANAGTTVTTATSPVTFDRTAPTVTAANITLSGATGTGGAFKIGDTVTASWNNTAAGDNNADVTTVTITLTSFGGTTVTATHVSGVWSASFTLVAGSIDATARNVIVTVRDTTGNTTVRPGTNNATVDTIAPVVTAAQIALSGATGLNGYYKEGDTVTATWNNTASGDNNADIARVTVNFSAFGGGTAVTATNTSGTWTATSAIAGDATNLNVILTATDDAGNPTTLTGTNNANIKTTTPPRGVLPTLAAASDSGTVGDNVTNVATPTLTGSGQAGLTVRLYDTNQTTLLGTATVGSGGTWSITTTTLTPGAHTLYTQFVDVAGNAGPFSVRPPQSSLYGFTGILIDTTVAAPVITGLADDTGTSATDGITKDPTLILNGTAEAFATVTLSKGGNSIGTATASSTGVWSFDYTATVLGAGEHSFTAVATDVAGNVSTTSATTLVTIDTAIATPVIAAITTDTGASATDGITSDPTLVFTGTAEAGSTVTVLRNGLGALGTATANGSGAWSFDYTATTLTDGTYLFTATAADTAGNTSAASADFPVTIDTTAPVITATTASGTFGTAFSYPIPATGSAVSYTATPLPAGLTLDATTGIISGTPTAAGNTTVALTATDLAGNTGTASLTVTLAKVTPTVTWTTPTGLTYGATLTAAELNATASVAGTFTYTPALGSTPLAGNQTLSVAFTPTDTANYASVPATTVILAVAKATPIVTWAPPSGITYGTALSATQLNATASVPGTFVYTPALGTTPTAGSPTLSVAFTPTDTANYASVPATTVTLAVAQRTLTLTGFTVANKVYDGTPTTTFNLAGATLNNRFGTDDVTVVSTGAIAQFGVKTPDATAGFAKPVSLVGLTLGGSTAANYNLALPSTTGDITTKPLTVSGLTAPGRAYNGSTTATLTGTPALVGIVPGDTVTLGGTPVGTFANANAGLAKLVTISGLTIGGASAGNYSLTAPTATANIAPADVTIAITNLAQTYDGTAKSATVTTTPGSVALGIVYANAGGLPPTSAGSYLVSANVTNPNYSGNANATLVIAQATQTIAFSAPAGTPALGTPVPLTATATSGLPVTFTVVSGPATVTGSTLTFTGSGTAVIRANQLGNENYLPAAPVSVSLTSAALAAQTIAFAPLGNKLTTDAAFTVAATASSGLPVAFTVVSGPATMAGNTLTLTGASGAVSVRASQAGNGAFLAAPDVTQSFNVLGRAVQQVFFGLTQNNDNLAVAVAPDGKSGTLICFLGATGEAFIVEFTINPDGTFSATVTSLASTAPDDRSLADTGLPPRAAAPATRTFSGRLVNGTLTGSIAELGLSFSAAVQPTAGPTAAISGLYKADTTNTAAGNAYTIVGTQGQVFALAVTPTAVAAGSGTVTADNTFAIQGSGNTAINGTIDQVTTTVTGTVSNATSTQPFTGASSAITRTDRLINLSSRVRISAATSRTLITGFVIGGTAEKRVLLRAVGPALTGFGVTGALVNPKLTLFNAAGTILLENDDWSGADTAAAFAATGAFTLTAGARDAALLTTLAPGAYTMQVTAGAETGAGLAEIYDASPSANTDAQRLVNLSTRGTVEPGADGLLIGGFVVTGNAPKRVLIRGIGPTLGAFGVNGTLADPRLAIYAGSTLVAQNDDWSTPTPLTAQQTAATAAELTTAAQSVGAFALGAGAKDAAILVTLAPGAYTAQVSATTTGVALVEIYEVP